MAGLTGALIVIVLFWLFMILWSVAEYILHSIGLYKIASREEIDNPWLAWIPVGAQWIVGKIAEGYDEGSGIKRKWGRILLISVALTVINMFIFMAFYFGVLFAIIINFEHSEPPVGLLIFFIIAVILLAITMAVTSAIFMGCHTICMYKIFEFCVPEKALKYWLFYMLIPIVGNICLIKCGNTEGPEIQEEDYEEPNYEERN